MFRTSERALHTLKICSISSRKHMIAILVAMQRIPVQACLKCKVRRTIRPPQLITRHPKGTHSPSKQSSRLYNSSEEAPGGGNSTWKCASTKRDPEDFEQPEAGDESQQLEKVSKAQATYFLRLS